MDKNKKILLGFAILVVIMLVVFLVIAKNSAEKKKEEEYTKLITDLCKVAVDLSETNPNVVTIDKEEQGTIYNLPLRTMSLITLGKDNYIPLELKNPKLSTDDKPVYFSDRMAMQLVVDSNNKVTCKEMVDLGEEPKITLKGEKEIVLKVGEAYVEPGFTATDKEDGDITSRVLKNGKPNVDERGDYTIIYYLQDSMGNQTSQTRTISVK